MFRKNFSHTINSYNSDPASLFTTFISFPLPPFFFNKTIDSNLFPMFSMFRAKLNLTGSSLSANSVYQFSPSLPSLSSLRRLSIRVRKFDDDGPLSSSRPFRNPNRGVTRNFTSKFKPFYYHLSLSS